MFNSNESLVPLSSQRLAKYDAVLRQIGVSHGYVVADASSISTNEAVLLNFQATGLIEVEKGYMYVFGPAIPSPPVPSLDASSAQGRRQYRVLGPSWYVYDYTSYLDLP